MFVNEENGIRRIGMVIGLKEERIAAYRMLHDGPGVRDLPRAYNILDFNIFLQKLPDCRFYEFVYYEYHGTDYEADIAKLAKEPRNIAWLKRAGPTQTPLDNHKSWAVMERIFFNP